MELTRVGELFTVQIIAANKQNSRPYLYFFVKDSEKHVRLMYLADATYNDLFRSIAQQYSEDGDCYLGSIRLYNDAILAGNKLTFPILASVKDD